MVKQLLKKYGCLPKEIELYCAEIKTVKQRLDRKVPIFGNYRLIEHWVQF
jgi:hypothetical protein